MHATEENMPKEQAEIPPSDPTWKTGCSLHVGITRPVPEMNGFAYSSSRRNIRNPRRHLMNMVDANLNGRP